MTLTFRLNASNLWWGVCFLCLFIFFREFTITVNHWRNLRKCNVQHSRMRLCSWERGNASAVSPEGGQRKGHSHGTRVSSRQPGCHFVWYNESVVVHLRETSDDAAFRSASVLLLIFISFRSRIGNIQARKETTTSDRYLSSTVCAVSAFTSRLRNERSSRSFPSPIREWTVYRS